jgi:hypothetical protein
LVFAKKQDCESGMVGRQAGFHVHCVYCVTTETLQRATSDRFACSGGSRSEVVQNVLSALVGARAFPQSGCFFIHRALDDQSFCDCLGMLESKGLVSLHDDDEHSSKWAFTEDGLQSLIPSRRVHSPRPAILPRGAGHSSLLW